MTQPVQGEKPKLNRPSQPFRVSSSSSEPSTSPIIRVDARHDRTTDRYVILWQDIRRAFKNAQCIMQDEVVVPFMTDADFKELTPPRILYRRAVVLDVVLEDTAHGPTPKQGDPVLRGTNIQQDRKANNKNKGHLSTDVKADLQSTLRSYNQLFRSFCNTMMSDDLGQAKKTMETMQRDLITVQTEILKVHPPQDLIIKAQIHILEHQQSLLERMSAVQGLLQTVVDQTSELMEERPPNVATVKSKVMALDLVKITKTVLQFLDHKDLVKCMRVNKAWHELTAPMVWGKIDIWDEPRYNPSVEALQRRRLLVNSLGMSQSDLEYCAIDFPNLRHLDVIFSMKKVEQIIDFIQRHTSLTKLELHYSYSDEEFEFYAPQLWRVVANLPGLKSLHLHGFGVRNISVSLPTLHELHIKYHSRNSSSDTIVDQLRFMSRCPALHVLEWRNYNYKRQIGDATGKDFMQMVDVGTWPELTALTVHCDALILWDSEIETILSSMPRVVVFDVRGSVFGILSFVQLQYHFATLEELHLDPSCTLTKHRLSEIVSSCPRLLESCKKDLAKMAADGRS
ncbi:hypothetical protein BC939DRAFT_446454 [Gamsiella multidivaricata]|uniref:uncharacterized protein n=1 Tax=Gamsiella multidivaricata TaxID=101098 RepID=UPI00221E889C|nr:uncharacterized protein BC939DRAFT_446454 [Gamsiella multidivaricata]KAG0363780.1 hypothetical protein BGZ54_008049 [Gamsiella multidivaricata]KAI7826998.1 hypothetical protein BC939DRAFT_446454 [Gamsiella multidivaricata]